MARVVITIPVQETLQVYGKEEHTWLLSERKNVRELACSGERPNWCTLLGQSDVRVRFELNGTAARRYLNVVINFTDYL